MGFNRYGVVLMLLSEGDSLTEARCATEMLFSTAAVLLRANVVQ